MLGEDRSLTSYRDDGVPKVLEYLVCRLCCFDDIVISNIGSHDMMVAENGKAIEG